MKIDLLLQMWKDIRVRIAAAFIGVVILAIGMRIITRNFFGGTVKIADVFMDSEVMASNSSVEIAGEYITKSLTDKQKVEVILQIANRIGLEIKAEDFHYAKDDNVSEVSVERDSKSASTLIKMISIDVNAEGEIPIINNYVLVRMNLHDNIESILNYQEMIQKEFKKLTIKGESSYLQFTGKYSGELTIDSKNSIADKMIKNLGGHIAYENREDELYTVYAYSGGIKDYIRVGDGKVNIQVAMNYNEQKDETVVYLATPIMNGSY